MLVWCTGISGSQRTAYIEEAADEIRADGRSCKVIDIGELLNNVPEHLRIGETPTELLDGNEEVLKLHRQLALLEMMHQIEEAREDVVLVSTHACFWRNSRLIPGLDMHFIKEKLSGVIDAFATVIHDTHAVWEALSTRREWSGRLSFTEVAIWRDFEIALTKMLSDYEKRPYYLLARKDPASGLAKLTREKPARSAYLSYPITAIYQSGDTSVIDAAQSLADRLRNEADMVVFNPLSIKDVPQTKSASGDMTNKVTEAMEADAEPYLNSQTIARDLQLIDQADMVIVYYPTDKMSPGVFTEMSHARDRRKPLYLCEYPGAPENVSPFLGLFHTESFSTVDAMIAELRAELATEPKF